MYGSPPHSDPPPVEAGDQSARSLVQLEEERAALQAALQLSQADFQNYRKRVQRDAALTESRVVCRMAEPLLSVLDNLQRALQTVPLEQRAEALPSGVRLVFLSLRETLAREGVHPYSPEGEHFDPTRHEAVGVERDDSLPPGQIVRVLQEGYRMGETVIRAARVVVAGESGCE